MDLREKAAALTFDRLDVERKEKERGMMLASVAVEIGKKGKTELKIVIRFWWATDKGGGRKKGG